MTKWNTNNDIILKMTYLYQMYMPKSIHVCMHMHEMYTAPN